MKLKSLIRGERWITWTAVMSIVSMATLVQSYVVIKLFFLGLFLLAFMVNAYLRRTHVVVYRRLVWFYVWVGLAGVVWAIVGLLRPANYAQGAFDALRLYVVWSAAFVILYTLLRAGPSLQIFHKAIVLAGILIPLINFVGLYDQYNDLGLISENVREELDMSIGFHEGYIQITSQNLDVMFLITAYLLSLQFRADAGKENSKLTKLALILSLILVVVSGRRALWLVVALMPCMILLFSRLTDSYALLRTGGKRFLLAWAIVAIIGIGALFILPEKGEDIGSIARLREGFSSENARPEQGLYLIRGFLKSPLFGSGFGAYAGYQRSDDRPWTYELTYHKMLFNMGIIGTGFLLALFATYIRLDIKLLRQFQDGSAIPLGLLIGFCAMAIGAVSNPYFGSFDLLFFGGMVPYLSTFQRGFGLPKGTAGEAL